MIVDVCLWTDKMEFDAGLQPNLPKNNFLSGSFVTLMWSESLMTPNISPDMRQRQVGQVHLGTKGQLSLTVK